MHMVQAANRIRYKWQKMVMLCIKSAKHHTNLDIRTPVRDLMDSLKWLKLGDRWDNQLRVFVFKCLKELTPSYLSSQFQFVHETHSHSTRNSTTNTLVVPKCHANSGQRTFHVRAANIWNNISQETRSEFNNMTVMQFKSHIKNIM